MRRWPTTKRRASIMARRRSSTSRTCPLSLKRLRTSRHVSRPPPSTAVRAAAPRPSAADLAMIGFAVPLQNNWLPLMPVDMGPATLGTLDECLRGVVLGVQGSPGIAGARSGEPQSTHLLAMARARRGSWVAS
jgi:hypothetical protein